MRKILLLSTALLSLAAAPAAFAQTSLSVAAPASMPPASQTPPEQTATPGAAIKPHAMRAAASTAEIRPGHQPGVGESYPASTTASNILPTDTRSPIAPRLPAPVGGENASPKMLLTDAQKALNSRQSGRAQEALERAETAMLQRSVPADQANTPDEAPGVTQVRMARDALAKGDTAGAKKAIAAAMSAT